MNADESPIEHAIRELRFTLPLTTEDPRYVERRDKLGARLLNRVLTPSSNRLLLAGPAGCGKSTELRRVELAACTKYTVVLCACDRDLDLHRPTRRMLLDYVLLKVAGTYRGELSSDIVKDVDRVLGRTRGPTITFIHSGVAPAVTEPTIDDELRAATFARLCAEIGRRTLPVLLLVDGLEKVPADSLKEIVLDGLARSSALDECQSLIVIPHWSVYGWGAQLLYQDTEVAGSPWTKTPHSSPTVLDRQRSRRVRRGRAARDRPSQRRRGA